MTLKDCYIAMGGNYEDVFSRLRSERMIEKFVLKFLDDGSFDLLGRSMAAGAGEEAFRAAHTIKGMCQNLGFTRLEKSSSQMTETLRHGDMAGAQDIFGCVREDYEHTVAAICAYRDTLLR